MDFFAHQDRAKASSKKLVLLYTLAVIAVVVSLNVVALFAVGLGGNAVERKNARPGQAIAPASLSPADHLPALALTTVSTIGLIGLATLFKQLQLGGDGSKVAEMLGGRPITSTPTDLDERKLLNVVEEMSIASGVPMPRVYILDQEQGINAFAAGTKTESAVIGVTRGAIQQLNRDQLQGVIAHEFSHILNGDMRLNLRMIALTFGIMAIGYIGLQIIRFAPRTASSGRKGEGAGAAAAIIVIGVSMAIIGYLGTLFGKMLQAAVSRQREYLADASAVQFTRNPSGIAGALKKIGGYSDGSLLQSSHAGEAAHLFFGDGVAGFLDSVFATHPPLDKRIRAIEPNFDGKMLAGTSVSTSASPVVAGASGFSGPPPLPKAGQRMRADPTQIRAARDIVQPREIAHAGLILEALPDELIDATHDPYDARAIALALLLDQKSDSVRTRQGELLLAVDEPLVKVMSKYWPMIQRAGPAARLPLLDLALPALRHLSPTQLKQFRELVDVCAKADRQLSPFELAVFKILDRELPLTAQTMSAAKYHSVAAVTESVVTLLSVLANAGGASQADNAFAAGAARVGLDASATRTSLYDPAAFALALDSLRDASSGVQRRVVDAAAFAVASDGTVRIEEIELMRAACAALAVPIPPFLAESAQA